MKCSSPICDIEIHVFKFQPIDSCMYVLLLNEESVDSAIVIDPCKSKEAVDLLHDREISNLNIILTHEHYDHISGVNYLRNLFACSIISNKICAEMIKDPKKKTAPHIFEALFLYAFRRNKVTSQKTAC